VKLYRPRKPVVPQNAPEWARNMVAMQVVVWEMLFNSQFPFQDTPTVRCSRTPGGYAFFAAPGRVGVAVSKGGKMNFRGEYDASANPPYAVQDVVVIRGGANAGSFVCIAGNPGATHPPTAPDTGNGYWICLANNTNALGEWM
jgi:hypothetical protein